ncbi:MAG: transcriptional regulator [Elusimicrobia bacterium]|nr:transcriptional regulator [Elusimicrobiota bacterium]
MNTGRFGELLKEYRIRKGLTLREFCIQNGFDPGNMSKMERGLLPPPSHEKMEKLAQGLGLRPGSPEWDTFFDAASLERGQLPQYVLSNEQLLQKLPIFLRTLNNRRITPEKLDELIEKLKKA